MNVCLSESWHLYRVTFVPRTNFKVKPYTIIFQALIIELNYFLTQFGGGGSASKVVTAAGLEYSFQGFSVLSRHSLDEVRLN